MIKIHNCTIDDISKLAQMNLMLIEDEKADTSMTLYQLEQRMTDFLNTNYKAFFFDMENKHIGYALVNINENPLYLRQFFITRENRRKGFGRMAFYALLEFLQIQEIDIDVYTWNQNGISFWKALGFSSRFINMRFRKEEDSIK